MGSNFVRDLWESIAETTICDIAQNVTICRMDCITLQRFLPEIKVPVHSCSYITTKEKHECLKSMGGLTLGQCQKEKTMAAFHDPKNKTKMKSSQLFAKQKGRTGEYVMV